MTLCVFNPNIRSPQAVVTIFVETLAHEFDGYCLSEAETAIWFLYLPVSVHFTSWSEAGRNLPPHAATSTSHPALLPVSQQPITASSSVQHNLPRNPHPTASPVAPNLTARLGTINNVALHILSHQPSTPILFHKAGLHTPAYQSQSYSSPTQHPPS